MAQLRVSSEPVVCRGIGRDCDIDEGKLVMAGPHPAIDSEDPGPAGFTGSLIIAEFDSLEDAQAWADADPFVSAGVYAKVTVKPYKKTLP